MTNGNDIKRPVSTDDIDRYEQAWADEMVNIWQEKIMHYRIRHTGALFRSLSREVMRNSSRAIIHKFLVYGLYQARGVGNGYKKANGGNLPFLDPAYRIKHNLGQPRKPRPWFMKRYYASILKLNDMEGMFYGTAYQGLMADAFNDLFGKALNLD